MHKKIFLLLVIFSIVINSQDKIIPFLSSSDFPDIKIIREESFDGDALWGYINGGADIFLEYGFDNLFLQEIELKNHVFKIELYKMINPNSAFGIYSVSHFKCDNKSDKINFTCITPYQIQCAAGDYYISIININGSEEEQKLSLIIFEKVFAKLVYKEIELPELFKQKDLVSEIEKIKYIKGSLGLQNGMIEWLDQFEGLNGFEIFLLPLEMNRAVINIAQINFFSEKEMKIYMQRMKININNNEPYIKVEMNGLSRIVNIISATRAIVFEASTSITDLENSVKGFL